MRWPWSWCPQQSRTQSESSSKTENQKHYANDEEELARYGISKQSKARVAQLNALNPEPFFGITWMSDWHTSEQFKKGLRKPVVLWDGREYSEKKKGERAQKKRGEGGSMPYPPMSDHFAKGPQPPRQRVMPPLE